MKRSIAHTLLHALDILECEVYNGVQAVSREEIEAAANWIYKNSKLSPKITYEDDDLIAGYDLASGEPIYR